MAQAAVLLIGFVGGTLVSPVALIGLTLVYFDQRVRMEAFDLVMMLGGVAAPEVAAWAPAPVAEAPAEGTSGDAVEPMGSDGHV